MRHLIGFLSVDRTVFDGIHSVNTMFVISNLGYYSTKASLGLDRTKVPTNGNPRPTLV